MTQETTKDSGKPVCIIRPKHGLVAIDIKELWAYRELFWFLAWRDILVRYKQTFLGIAWAILQPFLTMVVMTLIFGMLAGLPSGGVPYAVMTLSGILPWYFFSNAITESSNSLVASSRIISKIYFPRLIIPASAVISGAIDFLIGFGMLLVIMFHYKVIPTWHLLLLPFFLFAAFLSAFSAGLWFSALNVRYRDVKYIVPFITRIGLYVSSVVYSTQWVAERLADKGMSKWFFVYCLNPMVGVIDGFRWCILGSQFQPNWAGFWTSMGVVLVLLVSGAFYFRSTEKTFADVI